MVTRGAFQATLTLENVELWQVGLLAVALRDLGTGLCPIGFGKTRGLGRVVVTYNALEVAYPGRFERQAKGRDYGTTLYAVGDFHPEWRNPHSYGVTEETAIALGDLSPELAEDGAFGRVAFRFTNGAVIRKVLAKAAGTWKTFALARRQE